MSEPAPRGDRRAISRALVALAGALERIPAPIAYGCADLATPCLCAWGLAHELRAGRRGRGARRNLRIAYRGSLGRGAEWRLLARHGRHLAHLAVDFCRMPRLDATTLDRHVDTSVFDRLRELLAPGRGLLCVSAHLGAWELLGHAASVRGLPVTIVVRRRRHPALDAWLHRIRRSGGLRLVPQAGALAALRAALARGEIAGLLADEDAPRGRMFAPFLGTLAASSPAAAWLQQRSGAPIAVVSCERLGRERHRIRLWREIPPPAPGAPAGDAERRRVTAEINAALGEAIRARPSQWLWGSRRFATRPPGERPGPDGLPPRARPEPDGLPPRARPDPDGLPPRARPDPDGLTPRPSITG